ncbi:Uma2 family endonuclease [Pseudanabaena sp. FACHB-1998]|uniref:Uma2 family endonuclease n=1 Tax=Pseudanabaena sp. FACHB-1998 TaxID=2692858 RepID=UPI0016807B7F|nr:Uma2 family endonuclease [Pseudanabaena sp. FACHB-1998]MBD2175430.1 Uma2 family endonuclease [Pseudanabaena sp. FACHB-1998]
MIVAIKPEQKWQLATWDDYVTLREDDRDRYKLFFDNQKLWVEMGAEGINHSKFGDLVAMILLVCATKFPDIKLSTFGGCQMEKNGKRAVAPDIVVYVGDDVPTWKAGQSRFIDLEQCRSPDLVGEISDTTLAIDLDEKKRMYAELGIAEYWVIDVKASRLFAFRLEEAGVYQQCEVSQVLPNLAIALLEQTMELLNTKTNTEAAIWFSQQI